MSLQFNPKKNKNVLTIKTVQTNPFRTLFTAFKEIIIETNFVVTPDGIRILNMDKTNSICVHLFLEASKFEVFECTKSKIIIGINVINFFKFINGLANNETLTIYIEENDYNDGIVNYLGLMFEDGEIKQCKNQKMRLIEPFQQEFEMPDLKYDFVINLPSVDFQKIIKHFSGLMAEKIEIKSVGDELIFKGESILGTFELRRGETDGSLEFISKQDNSKIVQGEFSLKPLGHFIKCTNLSPQIELHLDNSHPLIVKYNVASIGILQLCLAMIPSISL